MLGDIAKYIRRKVGMAAAIFALYARSWRCSDRIVVIESDDWGSVRTSSREAFEQLKRSGYAVETSDYAKDSLETEEDLRELLRVLNGVSDRRGRPACITANMIMANPDFEAIARNHFTEYRYLPVVDACRRDPLRREVPDLWLQGYRQGAFVPQFHAREHVTWWQWLDWLRKGSDEARLTFELGMCGLPSSISRTGEGFFKGVYFSDAVMAVAGADQEKTITEGVDLFVRHFGFLPRSTMAPNCYWTDATERYLFARGVRYFQSGVYQLEDDRRIYHHMGQRSASGCLYLVRNSAFEPRTHADDSVRHCLRGVTRAFSLHMPAIINSHRVNFIGAIDPEFRRHNLQLLTQLLETLVRRWPDVVFVSSAELGYMIANDIKEVQGLAGVAPSGDPI